MADQPQPLQDLIAMSRELGLPEHDLAIFGEGNTSAKADDGAHFWVKASGSTLKGIEASGFAYMDHPGTVALLDETLGSDEAILAALLSMRVDGGTRYPSVEAMMHAFLLTLPGINFIGHTHPTSLNALLCSTRAEELVNVRLCPEQIVCCGPKPVYIPYADPGLELARLVRARVQAWIDAEGMLPRAILMQNHGLFALGGTPREVVSCSLMWQKMARIILGAMTCGGVNALTQAQVDRIFTRPDEKLREKLIAQK
jgi:rhamnose utilization protein RhaD (predicted bifunctional aldolase and dehydrogenase)